MIQEIAIDYEPTEKQTLFHRSAADEVLYGGAAGGGKSRAVVEDAMAMCLRYPGITCFLLRRTFPELQDTLLTEAEASIPKEIARYSKTNKEYLFPNRSLMKFRHCQHEKDRFRFAGAEIQGLYIDELTTFSDVIYTFLKTRLRAKSSLNIKPFVRCTSNPGGIGHGWVKSYFVDNREPTQIYPYRIWNSVDEQWEVRTRQYIPALPQDNPYISSDYIIELEQKPKAIRDALLLGKWDTFEGQAFEEWKNNPNHYQDRINTHVIDPFEIPDHWKRYRAFDHGYSKPYAVLWFAVDEQGRVYLYRELYGCTGNPNEGTKDTVDVIADKILALEKGEKIELGIADPAIWDSSKGESIAAMHQRKGVIWRGGNNRRVDGKMRFHNYLAMDNTGRPFFYVFKTCVNTTRTIPSLVYSQTKVEDVDTAGEDHCLVGDTLVHTDSGLTKIQDLAGKTGKVLSSDGQCHDFFDCRRTQINVDVYTVTLADGSKVTATPNHKFMLTDGTWKELRELAEGDDVKCMTA